MASVINYKFKSYKDFSHVSFEGDGLPLWELKYEIVTQRKMIAKDFDLIFYDYETDEQYTDEYIHIPKNSYIVVHRVPAWMSKNIFTMRERKPDQAARRGLREPPENYICFRCGSKGHFIQHCPTNNNRNFDIVKIRRPSGIPSDFLEKVEAVENGPAAMLITGEGFVKARPQTQEWEKQTRTQERHFGNRENIPHDLKCAGCFGLLKRPVITNCNHYYCEHCIQVDCKCIVCHKLIINLTHSTEKANEITKFLSNK